MRYLADSIKKDLGKKIVLLSGPRQVGKTTLSKSLASRHEYLNFDVVEHRKEIIERSWKRDSPLLILDELHKLKNWKSWLKGIYDSEGLSPPIIVTGSARLDIAKRMGDSLAGRFFHYRLYPFDVKELKYLNMPVGNLERLLQVGGFPEPYLSQDPDFPQRWRRGHLDTILRQDLIDTEQVRRILDIETLVELLRERVGSPVSAQALSEDLGVNDTTVRRWLSILENLFVVFKVLPHHRNISRSLKKAPKYYFYDNGLIRGDIGAKFENMVALSLLKEVHFKRDTMGRELELRYLRTKDGAEIDFAVVEGGHPSLILESKWGDDELSDSFSRVLGKMGDVSKEIVAVQLVGKEVRERDLPVRVSGRDFKARVRIRSAKSWLEAMDI